jgi:hypothetical protein
VSTKRRQIRHPVPPDAVEEQRKRRFAKRQAERERQAGIEDNDRAGGWLATADPAAHDRVGDHEHVWATIALEGGLLSHRYCLECRARRKP